MGSSVAKKTCSAVELCCHLVLLRAAWSPAVCQPHTLGEGRSCPSHMSRHKASSGGEKWVSGISVVDFSIIVPAIQGSAGCDAGTCKRALETSNIRGITDTPNLDG